MADTREQLIEQAAQVLEDTYLGGSESSWTLMARALADAGLLADPEQHAERLDRALWLWAEEKWRREQLLAQREQWWESVAQQRRTVEAERDLALWLHAEAVWQRDQLDRMEQHVLTAERDALQARIDAALAFHVEYSIYADCGHADHDDDEDIVDLGDKYVCAEGYQYSVCLACCCDGDTGGQHEVCTDSHCPDEKPNLCWPCPTRRALKDLAEPTGEVNRG